MSKISVNVLAGFLICIISARAFSVSLPDSNITRQKNLKNYNSSFRFSISAGMGVSLMNNPSFADYLRREIPYSNSDSIKSYNAGIEFFGGIEYKASKNFALKLDYSYYIRSLSYTFQAYSYNYDINFHQPYLMAYYLSSKNSFDLKFGAGAGYHLSLVKSQLGANTFVTYKAGGFSFRGEAVFAPYLSKSTQAYLAGFAEVSSFGSLKDSNGNYLLSPNSAEKVSMSGFGVGARAGIIFLIK